MSTIPHEIPNIAANIHATAEGIRLEEDFTRKANWKRWGPYLSERQWGTVREDYSADGEAWDYFPHDQARSRAYRWGEDSLLGFTDRECRLCFGLALWNGKDPILKERLFGLNNHEGNHGEDVKELYYYLDATPTYSYSKALYKYPQEAYPYDQLIEENAKRTLTEAEFEIEDTGIFNDMRYFDVLAEYAKGSPNDILIKLSISNRANQEANLVILPTLWFRNTWIWGAKHEGNISVRPRIAQIDSNKLEASHPTLGIMHFVAGSLPQESFSNFLFTENETNNQKLWGTPSATPYVKDAFHEYIVGGNKNAVNPEQWGTKVAAHYALQFKVGETKVIQLRLYSPLEVNTKQALGEGFQALFKKRQSEADEFYNAIILNKPTEDEYTIQRQAYGGLLWTKQFYHYSVKDWLSGDPNMPPPVECHKHQRNYNWEHLFNRDIISVPDKWEFPWYAAWDLAFHMIPFTKVDPEFAKDQLMLMMREWYMHPNGQLPAYEWKLDDVNPPVHAWACWRIYKMTGTRGQRDIRFLAEAFHKLLINFTWWVNRKDPDGKNLFSGGFLGLDNIGAFDRSKPLPGGAQLFQADGTAWMAFFCSTMLSMALELAHYRPAYDGIASKFFEHFMAISEAINTLGGTGLWNEEDGFYYDLLDYHTHTFPVKIRSIVGLIPLFAVEVLDKTIIDSMPQFKKRMEWFLKYRPDITEGISCMLSMSEDRDKLLLAIPSEQRLRRMLRYILDEAEFLSDFGVRSLSKFHEASPFIFEADGQQQVVKYAPAESDSYIFGGNSNWRGPIWFPLNFLLLESLEKFHYFYGENLRVEYPTGSGNYMALDKIAAELARRMSKIFLKDMEGQRPVYGKDSLYQKDPYFKNLILFYEYYNGDTGQGLGASHQTGWSALIAKLMDDATKKYRKEV